MKRGNPIRILKRMLISVFFSLSTCIAEGDPFLIAKESLSETRISTLSQGMYSVILRDLQRILFEMTGAILPITHGRIQPGALFVGTPSEAIQAGAPGPIPDLEEEEIYLFQEDGCLYLLGGGEAGVSHAVYRWLHCLGCRWFMPGEIGEHLPHMPTLIVDQVPYRHRPSFSMRVLWYAFGANSPECGRRFSEWTRRNVQGAHPRVSHGHNFDRLLPAERYFENHPEYYALIHGKRNPTQICTTHPDVIREVVQNILSQFDSQATGPYTVSLCPNDSDDFCQCARCEALDEGHRDPFDPQKPCTTDRLMVFWNAVAEGVTANYPNAILGFYAYVSHTAPPRRESIHPQLAPFFTTQQFCVLHSISDQACESRQNMRQMLSDYCDLSDRVYIYEYDPPVGHLDVPSPMYINHINALPLYRDMGIQGFSMECHDSWATTSPSLWINAQLQWDVDQDGSALMKSYIRDFFAEAHEPMDRYYTLLASCYERQDVHEGWRSDSMPWIYRQEEVNRMRSLMNQAWSIASTPLTRKRLQMVDLGLRYLEAHLVLALMSEHQDYGKAYEAFQRIRDVLDVCQNTNEDYILAREPGKWLERKWGGVGQYLPESDWFKERHEVWVSFPSSWRVLFEAEGSMCPSDWASVDFDAKDWHELKPNIMWHTQVNDKHKGRAWGRCSFMAPKACEGRPLQLFVGSLDERGSLYLNGEFIHQRTGEEEPESWTRPFTVEVTGKVRAGQENILAVAAEADSTIGGLWRPVWLVSPRIP